MYGLELLCLNEIDVDGRITAGIVFDVDDIDAAFDELDARYIAGEAAAHAQTWSVFAAAFSAASRHEPLELAPDWQGVDHRSGIAFPTGQMTEYLTAIWDQMPNFGVRIERVHRLTDDGAVVTHVANGTSFEGFAAEWRGSTFRPWIAAASTASSCSMKMISTLPWRDSTNWVPEA